MSDKRRRYDEMGELEQGLYEDSAARAADRLGLTAKDLDKGAVDRLVKEMRHMVRLMEPVERTGLGIPGLATLNGARNALAPFKETT